MDWRNKRVVVIDDEAPTRWLLALLFRERGAEVHLAGDGQRGLRMVGELRPDLIILDILMPGMNGWETLRLLRETTDVPVVVLTSTGTNEDVARCLDAGADDHVVKPFNKDVLMARCWAAVRRYPEPLRAQAPGDRRRAEGLRGTYRRNDRELRGTLGTVGK